MTDDMLRSQPDMNTVGSQSVKTYIPDAFLPLFTYDSYDINIKQRSIIKIEVSTLPSKIGYYTGDELDLTSGVIMVTYDQGDPVYVPMTDANCTVSGFDSSEDKSGKETLTVNYKGFDATFEVQVFTPLDVAKAIRDVVFSTESMYKASTYYSYIYSDYLKKWHEKATDKYIDSNAPSNVDASNKSRTVLINDSLALKPEIVQAIKNKITWTIWNQYPNGQEGYTMYIYDGVLANGQINTKVSVTQINYYTSSNSFEVLKNVVIYCQKVLLIV